MKKQLLKLALSTASFGFMSVAHGQQLAKIPSNFDVNVWARPTEYLPNVNFPRPWGDFPDPCSYSHFRYDDPIQKPGQFSQAPLHVFFGNRLTNANSTYTSLRSDGEGTCIGGPINRSAFYFPAMMVGGKVIAPDLIDTYYRGTSDTKPFPRGLQMVFGPQQQDSSYIWDAQSARYGWSFGGVGQWWGGGNEIYKNFVPSAMPDWAFLNHDYRLSVRAVSPDCWNGVNLDSADHHSHLAYSGTDASVTGACPASHPVKIPQVTVTAYFDFIDRADLQTWYLSSDRFGGKTDLPGTNWYVGMIPAWDSDIENIFVTKILNTNYFGALSRLGDGRLLEEPPTSKIFPGTQNTGTYPPFFLWSLRGKFTLPGGYVQAPAMRLTPPAP